MKSTSKLETYGLLTLVHLMLYLGIKKVQVQRSSLLDHVQRQMPNSPATPISTTPSAPSPSINSIGRVTTEAERKVVAAKLKNPSIKRSHHAPSNKALSLMKMCNSFEKDTEILKKEYQRDTAMVEEKKLMRKRVLQEIQDMCNAEDTFKFGAIDIMSDESNVLLFNDLPSESKEGWLKFKIN